MKNLFSHIEYLLYSHDCVIVPQLGAFVVRHVPAEYNPLTSTFLPPREQILFNPELTHSDGLLAASVARSSGVSYQQASAIVTDEVTKLLGALNRPGSRCPAGQLGLLIRAPHGVVTFEPSRRYFSTPALYKLPEVATTTVAEREEAEKRARRSRTLTLPNLLRIAASIIVLVAIGFLTTTPLPVNENELHLASLSLPRITVPESMAPEYSPIEIELNIAVPSDTLAAYSVITPTELARRMATTRFSDSDPYYLVVASVASTAQAHEFMRLHPACHLETIKHFDNIRIIAATGTSAGELMELHKAKLTDEFPMAWPCHR